MKENDYTHKPLLTKREREVFELLVQDKTTREIAGELFISEKTVRNHISNAIHIFCKIKKECFYTPLKIKNNI
ncbi:helix-turn-helix domain-containing protein [Cytobacillus horneckiae]|uniref:helix-turn-helix domain-containing protein n=1 Tax=Cytobacillus horneckiae TaxID=549687 RepID=UPI003D1EDAE9